MAKLEFLTLQGLSEFKTLNDAKVSQAIEEATKNSIKTVSLSADGYTIYFYTKTAPVTESEAVYSINFPSPVNIDGKADKVQGATDGNLAALDSNGNLKDAGKKVSDFENAGAADSVRTELLTLIGTIPPQAVSKTIVAYINEQVEAGKYDDTDLKALANNNKVAIDILNGTGDGSVTKTVAQALTEFVAGAPEDLDTYKELTDWIVSHSSDAAEMDNKITKNINDIKTMKELIGTLPDGIKSKNVVDYIQEYVGGLIGNIDFDSFAQQADLDATNVRVTTLESDMAATKDRVSAAESNISAIQNKLGNIPTDSHATTIVGYIQELINGLQPDVKSLLERVRAIENKVSTLETQVDVNTGNIETLQTLVGDGYDSIKISDIQGLFTT